ncbi:cobyrinate a,c-diamide synthase [Denitromonas ohlonensis]|uniref:Cobyrinate a,c-diamide synthase n=2 Tax=Denitromonas TaxID=139331 RepID=A0A557RNW4_9RHOO|nr:cobyrinate a,c-diamide synthase [Denitromonas ohlonensis]TVO66859.1 cobyrinate a,c-diamide synthase [Denitromonas ohlonensis]TVO79729.1 cobyrinate a,c-diamide synthase [Denitromonas ohlonensis]TVT48224.1 MAG: cobyrinate a,c-diamide synthase [Denitromonas halophila]TVT71427.1 MAG: cobyrinate a,c-diamide synthase [Denitromonas halophila]
MTPADSSAAVHPCPALLIAAPASGQGKTTATAALARWHTRQGRRVRVFKAGPDFLDPMILAQACGQPVYQLDLWMGGEDHCRALLHQAAAEADLILVEGVMGLHDGIASSASLADTLGLPVLAVIDGSAMAQTFGAIALGLARYRPSLNFYGVLANRVGSPGHAEMLRESLPADMAWLGALPRNADAALPSRHLGLVQADEIADLTQRIDRAADALDAANPPLPAPVAFNASPHAPTPRLLDGITIAVARDAAFAFLYPANLDTLRALGAELCFFSPLSDAGLPRADALYLPGGYPELHLNALAANRSLVLAVHAHHRSGKPIVAECGGMLALLDALTDHQGHRTSLIGLLPGEASMAKRLVNLGMHSVLLPEGEVRGHTFHHAQANCLRAPHDHSIAQRHNGTPEPIYRDGRLFASFVHLYFPSNPAAIAALFTPQLS